MAHDLCKRWYINLDQYIFPRALAQVEGIIRQRVLWPQFLSNLFYELKSISFLFLPQYVSRIKTAFCGILLPSSNRCKAGNKTCTWRLVSHSFLSKSRFFAHLLFSAYRWTPFEGQPYARSARQGQIWPYGSF